MEEYITKMTPKELFRQLVYLYRNARNPVFYHPSIKRGRSHSISSQVEDLFAFFLSLNLTKDYQFFVDQPLNLGKRQFYPDISVVENRKLIHAFDVKTDLGWKRNDFSDFCKNKNDELKDFFNVELSVTDGISKNKFLIKTPQEFHYHIVILSGLNIKREKLKKHLNTISKLKYVHAYVLFPNEHPNYYGDDVEQFINTATVNVEDFEKIENALTCAAPDRYSAGAS